MKTKQTIRLIAVLLWALPVVAQAQSPSMTPQKYCIALGKSVDRYISSDHGANHLGVQGYGKAACKQHDVDDAIPVLEQRLEASKLPLPPHPASVADHVSGRTADIHFL